MTEAPMTSTRPAGISRRSLLGALGIGAAAAAGGAVVGFSAAQAAEAQDAPDDTYGFYGEHQTGITTAMQQSLHFASLDVTTDSRAELVALLRTWTTAAAAMMAGKSIGGHGAFGGSYDAPPEDTGEAEGLPASHLTITFGFGSTLFRTHDGIDRFGIADEKPATLTELPHFPGDQIDPLISGGDLCIQACADDAQVAVHAVRTLVRMAFGIAAVKWSQMGFGRSSTTTHDEPTPRNLFGFKDGTANITADETADLDDFVWVQPDDSPAWMDGGSYLAVRKIRMTIETWDRSSMREQEAVFGRTKREGAPLSGGSEFDEPDFTLEGSDGEPVIPVDSHMALAHRSHQNGHRILRRAYHYADGSDGLGRLNAGLFFLAYQRDLQKQFVPMQMALAKSDRMNEYVKYISSATFAVPPGVQRPGGYIGQSLFDAS